MKVLYYDCFCGISGDMNLAAILASNVEEFTQKIDFLINKIAYGIGHKDLEIPNVLRIYLGEKEK